MPTTDITTQVHLFDFNGYTVRVIIESTDGLSTWTTVGCSADIIDASWQALRDSMEYKLMRDGAV